MAEDAQIRLRDDEPCMEPAVTLEAFAEQTNAVAVRIEPGGDARELLPHLDRLARVDIAFPAFTDGRGYSAARILREAGFTGELRAVGDVLVDQFGGDAQLHAFWHAIAGMVGNRNDAATGGTSDTDKRLLAHAPYLRTLAIRHHPG